MACLMVGAPTGHSEETEAFVPTAAGLRDLLQTPAGSLSYGTTNSGKLLGGERIGLKGKGWKFLERVRSRKTNYGTAEMVNTLTRLAAHVHGLWPKAPLSLCNISLHEGGKTPWHASHRAGRDVDILFYARDRRGRSRGTRDFIRFNRKGTSGGKRPRYTFDAARNLEVVRWLVEDSDAKVQWIFVADWLKKQLMSEAKEAGLSASVIKRLKRVMHQPQDSSPHDDHFHVRLYCSTQDRLHGCVNRGPSRSWVDSGDAEHAEKSRALANLLSIPSVDYRKRALSKLQEIRAYQAIPEVVDALGDPNRGVATKALEVLRVFGRKDAVPGILAALKATTESEWAAKLYNSLKAVASKDILKHAFGLLNAPDEYLHPEVLKDGASALQRAAIALVIRHGKEEGVPPLITLLTSSDADVRETAHEGLLTLTNQKIAGSMRSGSAKKRQKIVKRWKQFYKNHGREGWLA